MFNLALLLQRNNKHAEAVEYLAVLSRQSLNCSIRCGHVLLTTEKIRALIDNIRGKKDCIIDGEVVKKDDGDG